ncbi:MAG: 50S ribosomal protein L18 [Candidatus Omnitrophota bacterium]
MRIKGRERRHRIIRKKVIGTNEKPRLCVFRANKNFQAQLIDDIKGHTVVSLSTCDAGFKSKIKYGGNVKAAEVLGAEFAERSKKKGFSRIVFDRAGYKYHGRIKAFADAARKNGLVF